MTEEEGEKVENIMDLVQIMLNQGLVCAQVHCYLAEITGIQRTTPSLTATSLSM